MAISVAVPKNLSGIKTKVAMNLTKRQLICFGAAGAVGIPFYIFTKDIIGTQASALIMVAVMLPFFFLAMYEKDGFPAEKILYFMIRQKFLTPGIRPYKSENLYNQLEERIEGSDNAQDGVEEAPLVAEDVQNLVLINREYSAGTRTTVYDFECDIRGEHDTLQYTLEHHDDGEGYTIHTQKDDIWERMSEPELERLEGIISRESLYFKYHDKIAGAKSVEDMEEIQFSIMEDESPYFSAVSDRVWKEFNQKENELSGENRETSRQDVQKPEEVSDTPLEPDIEVPVKQAEPQIDKTGAVNFHITDDDLGIGTVKEKFRRNVEAIRTLEKIESERRIATPEEQEILSQYVGWGGLADAFDESKSAWSNEYQELTVEAVCDMVICDDAVITHELTVRFAEDGSFQYLGNEILNDGIMQIPDYQYRIKE